MVAVSAVIAAASACGSAASETASETRNVFSLDNREDVLSGAYPWSAVGRIDSGCTGTLVAPQLVLTAAHCVFDSEKKVVKKSLAYFRPNLIRGVSKAPTWIEHAWFGSETPEDDRGRDWAILKLEKPIGAGPAFRWVPVRDVDVAAGLPFTTSLAGYSSDRDGGDTASVHRGCYIHEKLGERLLHDCDATGGVSGGPMITVYDGTPNIVAISVSEYRGGASDSVHVDAYRRELANVAIGTKDAYRALATIREAVENGRTPPAMAGVVERRNPNVPGAPDVPPLLPNPGHGDDELSGPAPLPDAAVLIGNAAAIKTAAVAFGRLAEVLRVNAREYWHDEALARVGAALKDDLADIIQLEDAIASSTAHPNAVGAMQRLVTILRQDHQGLKATWSRVSYGFPDASAEDLMTRIQEAHVRLDGALYQ
jgi:protease YdgD